MSKNLMVNFFFGEIVFVLVKCLWLRKGGRIIQIREIVGQGSSNRNLKEVRKEKMSKL